jgi:cell division protein FtsI/penicillin-binding protein 2
MLRSRLLVAAGMLVLWVAGIEVRLFVLQVRQHDSLVARADRQQMSTIDAPAKRGEIYDRNGHLLAYSVDADTIYAVPTEISDPARAAKLLCEALEDCTGKAREDLQERLSKSSPFQFVRRRATPQQAKRVAALGIEGIAFRRESKRFYPNRELAAHLLGYVGVDNVGLDGLEATYDKTVRGREGKVLLQTDARRTVFSRLERSPTAGASLELTIDEQLQHIAEREVRAGVEAARADGGTAVIMDPHNGEILAMASWPTFNPNDYGDSPEIARRNRAVQDIYEPGSTFKIVTASAALQDGVWKTTDMIDTQGGVIKFPGRKAITDMGHDYGTLSFTDVIVHSSNVGAIKIGLKVGAERLGLYAKRFGFGRATSPDFPSESPGIVWNPARMNDSALASMSMGYQVAVTPLQMATAASAVANGGTLYEPHVVRAIIKHDLRTVIAPKVVREAIHPDTAAAVTEIMEKVVTDGTGRNAKLGSNTVAGKTGTADKLVNGRYNGTQQNVSFVGFVPAQRPALTVIVMIDSPRVGGDTGGLIAAPIWKRIADACLRQMGITPTINPEPPVIVARNQTLPVAPTAAVAAPNVMAIPADMTSAGLPDLRGMSAREALRELAKVGLSAKMQGVGVVVEQDPPAGSAYEPGATCTLVLNRRLPPPRQTGAVGDQR